jgi:hypothetical protein
MELFSSMLLIMNSSGFLLQIFKAVISIFNFNFNWIRVQITETP